MIIHLFVLWLLHAPLLSYPTDETFVNAFHSIISDALLDRAKCCSMFVSSVR